MRNHYSLGQDFMSFYTSRPDVIKKPTIQEQYPQYFTESGALKIPTITGPQYLTESGALRMPTNEEKTQRAYELLSKKTRPSTGYPVPSGDNFKSDDSKIFGIDKKLLIYAGLGLLVIMVLKRR